MAAPKTITIIGVTGTQGSAVAKTFLDDTEWHVRGLTRSTTSPTAQRLAKAGVELVQADLDDKSSLLVACRGSHAIYANTDFFALTKYPNLEELLASRYPGLPLNQACMKHEIQQGRNMVDATASILAEPGSVLKSFVLSTLSHASKWSHGAIQNLLHFDSKALVEQYLRD